MSEFRQMFRFALVGICNTAFGYGLIFGCMYIAGMSPIASNVVGYGVGLLFAYQLHRSFTFDSKGRRRSEIMRFLIVFGVAYSANLATLYILTRIIHLSGGLSQVFSGTVYVLTSFLLSKFFVFTTVRSAGHADTPESL